MFEQSFNYMIVKADDVIHYICCFPLSHGATVPDGSRLSHC